MIVDWIYSNPTWLWGTVVVVLSTAIACAGLLVFDRLVPIKIRREHNDLAGFTISIVSVLYAVLLAFIAIATWESFSKASEIVENESDFAGGMYLDQQFVRAGPRPCPIGFLQLQPLSGFRQS